MADRSDEAGDPACWAHLFEDELSGDERVGNRPEPGSARHTAPVVDVVTETVIARPVREVAAYAGDPSNAPEWYANIDSVTWETEPVVAVGSRAMFVARFLGRTLRYTYEIVEHLPGERLVMRTAEGPFPMETTYTWEAVGPASTRMTLRNRGEPSGFGAVVAPLLSKAMRRANTKDLRALRAVLGG